MRNVIFAINISIDGYCGHTDFTPEENLYEYFTDYLNEADLSVYGRITYELMVPYWPDVAKAQSGTKAEVEFAEALTAKDKVVFSKTLNSADENTRIVRDNLENEIRKLKQQPGKKISIGGVNLHSQLIALGLIDEYYLVIHPIIVGKGTRLFEGPGFPDHLKFKLIDSKTFQSGCIALHYVKR